MHRHHVNGPLKILVADDEKQVLNLIYHTLKPYPYTVETAESPQKALDAIRENRPDILITDIHMPGMTGIELLQAALVIHPDLLAIAITGYGNVTSAVAFMKSGGIDYLQKPVNREVLLLSVRSAADRWRMRNRLRNANHALAASERRYRSIFNNAPVGIFQTDLGGRFLRVNPTLARMFGYSNPHEMFQADKSGRGPFRENFETWLSAIRKSCSRPVSEAGSGDPSGPWVRTRIEGLRQDNGRIITRSILRKVQDEKGEPIHIEGFAEDITEAEIRRAEFRREMERAKDLYDRVAVPELPLMPDLFMDVACIPAEQTGGDLIEIVRVDDRRLLIFMADITGHGIPAAMIANTLKTLFREIAEAESDPARICRHLNRTIHKFKFILPDDLIALFCGLFDPGEMSLTYYLSGLPRPLILRDSQVISLAPTGLPFGIFEEMHMECFRIPLRAGDRFIAITDGITEAVNPEGEVFGSKRFQEAACPMSREWTSISEKILSAASGFRKTAGFTDDIIVLAIQFLHQTNGPTQLICNRFRGPGRCRFRFQTRHIRIDRAVQLIMDYASQQTGAPEKAFMEELCLAFTELFTNAVEHGSLEMTPLKHNPQMYDSEDYWTIFAERSRSSAYGERAVDVACRFEVAKAVITISDQGPGFRPDEVPDPSRRQNRDRLSGRGIAIARMNLDDLSFSPDGRTVTLVKRFTDVDVQTGHPSGFPELGIMLHQN